MLTTEEGNLNEEGTGNLNEEGMLTTEEGHCISA